MISPPFKPDILEVADAGGLRVVAVAEHGDIDQVRRRRILPDLGIGALNRMFGTLPWPSGPSHGCARPEFSVFPARGERIERTVTTGPPSAFSTSPRPLQMPNDKRIRGRTYCPGATFCSPMVAGLARIM